MKRAAWEPPRPLSRIASGGELSRVMLALSLVLAPEQGLTILFDEADAGIGGSVAEAVGRRLQRLAKGLQVLCVTHLPQIAARADQHFRVVKTEVGGRTLTTVESLDAQGREDELSRMLAGDKVTPTARAHARALLKSARD
jgi:DNA repair protein RecN (Recombination protein N)